MVYTLTNAAAGNAVARFRRAADGRLAPAGAAATGGRGTGSPLGSQGALAMSEDGTRLYAVNAGSATVAVFAVAPGGELTLRQTVATDEEGPISLALRQGLLYVLTTGGEGAIRGFDVNSRVGSPPSPGSTRPLGGPASDPGQVGFSPAGDLLVVTEKAANRIVTYAVAPDGRPGAPAPHPSSGATPFGFAFDPRGTLVVTEAHGGPDDQSAVSSYRLAAGVPQAVSPSVPTRHNAACWIAVTADGRYVYAADARPATPSPASASGRTAGWSACGRTGTPPRRARGATPATWPSAPGSATCTCWAPSPRTSAASRCSRTGACAPAA